MNSAHGNQKASDQEIIETIESIGDPVASASEIASELSMTRTGITNRLKGLRNRGEVEMKNVGNGYVWWVKE